MAQVAITGQVSFINQTETNPSGTFSKVVVIVCVMNGTYQSFMPVEFHQNEIQTLVPQLAANNTYTFNCYVQGTNKMFQSTKTGGQVAYLSLKCTSIMPAQNQAVNNGSYINNQAQAQQQPQAQNFQQQPQNFQPQQQPQQFTQPSNQQPQPQAQQPQAQFQQPAQQPQQDNNFNQGFNNPAQGGQGFGFGG